MRIVFVGPNPRIAIIAALALTAAGCGSFPWSRPAPVETGYVTHPFRSASTGSTRRYAMYIPPEYNKTKRPWPLLLFLHGAGESGDDVDMTIRHGPLKTAMMRGEFPFVVVAPQSQRGLAAGGAWAAQEEDVFAILNRVRADYRIDDSRLYLTGLSMGGFGCFALAARKPGVFAAVAPICGGGNPADARKYEGAPFWIFHGDLDPVVPVGRSIEMYEAMKAMDQDVKLTRYPDLGHDSWTRTYDGEEIYAWLLSHEKPK